MNRIVPGIGHYDWSHVERLGEIGWSENVRLRDLSSGRERRAFPLANIQVFAAAIEFCTAVGDRNLLLLRVGVAAYRGSAILAQRGHRMLEGNFRLRSRNFPGAGGKVHLTGAYVYAHGRGAVGFNNIVLDRHERITLYRIDRSVRER